MNNSELAKDYITRARFRLEALELFIKQSNWADVVREAQEVVELSLKALLRFYNVAFPALHDVGDLVLKNQSKFGSISSQEADFLAETSRRLRLDREISFYGTADVTPLQFYREKDARDSLQKTIRVVELVEREICS